MRNSIYVDANHWERHEKDSVNGIKAGKRAGMYVVGYKGSEIFQDTKEADEEIASFSQLNIDRFLEPPSKIN